MRQQAILEIIREKFSILDPSFFQSDLRLKIQGDKVAFHALKWMGHIRIRQTENRL